MGKNIDLFLGKTLSDIQNWDKFEDEITFIFEDGSSINILATGHYSEGNLIITTDLREEEE